MANICIYDTNGNKICCYNVTGPTVRDMQDRPHRRPVFCTPKDADTDHPPEWIEAENDDPDHVVQPKMEAVGRDKKHWNGPWQKGAVTPMPKEAPAGKPS